MKICRSLNYFGYLFLVIAICFTTNVSAQTTAFTYQGRLTDSSATASGIYEMRFTLHSADSGAGNQVGSTITDTNVQVTNGIFSVTLDFGAVFSGADRWIEISVKKTVEAGYTTLAPRQKVNSVPYAVKANGSANLSPVASQVSSSTNTENAALDVTGAEDDGSGNLTNRSRFRFNQDGGFYTSGTPNVGFVPTTGEGARMMWYPGKWAFRAGKVESFGATYWDEANIGKGSVAMGDNTRATGDNSFAANLATTASGDESVAFGNNGTASGDRSFAFNGAATGVGAVAIGSGAQATGDESVAMGQSPIAGGLGSIVIGPSIANGSYAVAIGLQNSAAGNFSIAIGKNARACSSWDCPPGSAKQGAVVIGDGCAGFSSDGLTATANNQVNMRGCGGYRFFTNQGMTSGVTLDPGGSAWNNLSDRNMKENIVPVNSRDVLQRVLKLPVSTWNYKSQDASIRHMGAMAQDFKAAFNLGSSDKTITTIDPDGVALAAIQGLNEEIKDRDKKIEDQQQQLNSLQQQVKQQQALIEGMKKMLCAEKPEAEICRQ